MVFHLVEGVLREEVGGRVPGGARVVRDYVRLRDGDHVHAVNV